MPGLVLEMEKKAYKYGFRTPDHLLYRSGKGLSTDVITKISSMKQEPEWMYQFRLSAYDAFKKLKAPEWGPHLALDFDDLYYYTKATEKSESDWSKVPANIRNTFDKLGIPEAERKFLAGATAQYESEVIYHNLKKEWESKGVIFTDMDTAVKKHPDLVRKYIGTLVPITDNKFAALNSAAWSGGSFIYVPKGVDVQIPLQAYFRINTEKMGQFERTLIIAEEGSSVHYVEGCFTKGTLIHANPGFKPIEEINVGDLVLTHNGRYKKVYHAQFRPYTGTLYRVTAYGNPDEVIEATEEHPFLCVVRERRNERNRKWSAKWVRAKDLKVRDYLVLPRNKHIHTRHFVEVEVADRRKGRSPMARVGIPSTSDFFRLAGYFLSEGSISNGAYLNFSFASYEKAYIADVKRLLKRVFGIEKIAENVHKMNNGVSVVVSSVRLCRAFESLFGKGSHNKRIPEWMMAENPEKQKQLVISLFLGDGNYYKKNTQARGWLKEILRLNTTSAMLAKQTRDMLLRLGIPAFVNSQDRSKEGRKRIYTVGVTGGYMSRFGAMFGISTPDRLHGKKRASMFYIDDDYLYLPIRKIEKKDVRNTPVYNFSVEDDESYVANNVAAHNCSAPIYSAASLHAAVVEVFAHRDAHVRYTTIQNWSTNVYNLVTKRAIAYQDALVEWVDGNVGSKVTMKYPTVILKEPGARADMISVAYAGKGQVLDAGARAIHLAPGTSSKIISKSVSREGGRSSYRGLVRISKGATGSKSSVRCDALILDDKSRSDTYPRVQAEEEDASVAHEATVGRIGEEQLFYLMSRGISEQDAVSMIVLGFMEPFTKELPMEYAVELNRLVQLEMKGAVG